tara:strand:+ start:268 stop:465 length:198 start_codon:yes stop_codon:yes gene_type:complete
MLSLFFLSEILAEKVLAQFEGKMTYTLRGKDKNAKFSSTRRGLPDVRFKLKVTFSNAKYGFAREL